MVSLTIPTPAPEFEIAKYPSAKSPDAADIPNNPYKSVSGLKAIKVPPLLTQSEKVVA